MENTTMAACRFCGQMREIDISQLNSEQLAKYDNDFNELATLECDCVDAKTYQLRLKYLERAKKKILDTVKEDYMQKLLVDIVQKVYDRKLDGAKLKVDGENSISVSQDSKGNIYVSKTYSTGKKVQL